MKIYNEIVIDMNPESSSYGETLHEDSFEYEGKLALLKEWKSYDWGYGQDGSKYTYQMEWGGGIDNIKHIRMYKDGALVYDDANNTQPKWARETIAEKFAEQSGGSQKFGSAEEGKSFAEAGFTYTEGEFDPTSEEFRKSVQETGGYGQLAAGFGVEEGDFEEFYGKPLEFLEQEYGAGGTLEKGRDLDLATIAETRKVSEEGLRSAKESYGLGMKTAGLQTGRSLFDIKQQTEQQMAQSGFATQGAVAGVSRRAEKGVMADYNLQQRQLAEGMTQAQSAFDRSQKQAGIAEDRVGIAETQAGIDYERGKESFWKGEEEEYYNRLDYIESLG